MQLKVIKPFSWAHRGCEIEHFAEDDMITTEDKDLIEVATREKWAVDESKAKSPPANKAKKAAPENKSAAE